MTVRELNIVTGNLPELAKKDNFDVILHGAHCYNYMGHGVAAAISKTFPAAFKADQATPRGLREKMGTYSYAVCKTDAANPVVVINAYTQFYYGIKHYQSQESFNYKALERVCEAILYRLGGKGLRFGFPLIGGDRGNADPHQALKIVNDAFRSENRTLVLFGESGRRKQYRPVDFAYLKGGS